MLFRSQFCVLKQDRETLDNKEIVLERDGDVIYDIDSTIAYPVLALSDIRANPVLVHQRECAARKRIMKEVKIREGKEIAQLQKSIQGIKDSLEVFQKKICCNRKKLKSTIMELRKYHEEYRKLKESVAIGRAHV